MKDKDTSSQKKRTGNRNGPAARSVKPPAPIEARFRAVFENSRDAIGVSKAGVHVFENPAYRELFGFPPDADLAGKPVLDLIAPACRDLVREYTLRRMRGESAPSNYQTRGLRVDGSEFAMEVNLSLYQENGENRTLVILRDITRRKMAEEEIAERGALLQQIMDTASVAIGLVDKRGRIIHANKRMADMFGCTMDELMGSEYVDHIHPAERDAGREKMLALLASKIPSVEHDRLYLRKDGTEFWGHLTCRRFHDAGGNELGLIGTITDISEHKRSIEALRQSETKYRRLYNETPVLLHSIDRDGTVIEVNDYWLKTLGYERDEVIGRKVTDFYTDASREYAREVMHPKFFRDGFARGVYYQLVKKNGVVVDALLSATAERDATGAVVRSLAVIEDVTERRRMEEALSKSEKMLQTIIEAEPECVKVLDEHANLILMNRAGLDMLQADSLDQVKGQCVCPMVTPEYRQAFLDLTNRVFQGGSGILHFEIVGIKGRHLWLETHAVPLRNEKNEIAAMLCVTRNVTERRQAEEALREKEGKYRLLFESASDGIFIQDTTGFIDCNQKGAEMYGLPKEKVIGRPPGEFAPERQPDGRLSSEVAAEKIQAALNGVPQVFEWQPLRADGNPFDVEITLSRLELGGKVCLQAIVRDIGERKRLEQERLKTQKLESIGTLAGGIAHDFNNLLQGVFGYISMAKMTFDQKEKSLAMLEQAEKALHQSVNLTTQLLTFSKGGKPIKKTVSLPALIENAAKFALSGSRATYRLRIEPGLWQVEADEGQLGQVIQNIVLNADQAMPLGGSVAISARNLSAFDPSLPQEVNHGDTVMISVQDSGVGIPEESLSRIFDPYFTTKEKGSGLGLATSYSIIRNHGGLVRVASEVGKGTAFSLYLPASGGSAEELKSPAIQAGPEKGISWSWMMKR